MSCGISYIRSCCFSANRQQIWREVCCFMRCRPVGHQYIWEGKVPITVVLIKIGTEHREQCTVKSLDHPIWFGVVGNGSCFLLRLQQNLCALPTVGCSRLFVIYCWFRKLRTIYTDIPFLWTVETLYFTTWSLTTQLKEWHRLNFEVWSVWRAIACLKLQRNLWTTLLRAIPLI